MHAIGACIGPCSNTVGRRRCAQIFVFSVAAMRFLHTSDLHLGRSLYNADRSQAFTALLEWLVKTVEEQSVECLIIAGDVFDNTTPTYFMQQNYYRFLTRVTQTPSCRHVVVTGGNHDSAQFLNAAGSVLSSINVHVVGQACESIDDEVLVLDDRNGQPQSIVLAVPYLREKDIRASRADEMLEDKERNIVEGVRAHYRAAFERAQQVRSVSDANLPVMAVGHLFAAECNVSDEERTVYIGSLAAVPADVFDKGIDYVALGHVHRPQCVGADATRRYCGAPLVMNFSEADRKPTVLVVDIDRSKESSVDITPIPVPAFDRLVRLEGNLSDVLEGLATLKGSTVPVFVEIVLTPTNAMAVAVESCREAAHDAGVQIARIITPAVLARRLAQTEAVTEVASLSPQDVFALRLSKEESLSQEEKESLIKAHESILQALQEGDKAREGD